MNESDDLTSLKVEASFIGFDGFRFLSAACLWAINVSYYIRCTLSAGTSTSVAQVSQLVVVEQHIYIVYYTISL